MGVSIGLVGLGEFGSQFVPLYKDHPDVKRLALCDLNKDRLETYAKQYEISETYQSLDDICKSDIEALVIITQQWLHAPQAIQAMKAGKHVYTAVPAARSIEECDALVRTVRETGLIYMNGETDYFLPSTVFCRRKAEEGAFGEFVHSRSGYFHPIEAGVRENAMKRWGKEWGEDKAGGIPLYYPSHSISKPVSIMKAHMTEVSAQGFVYPNEDWYRKDTIFKNEFSNETALFKMSNEATALICEYRRISCWLASGLQIYGTEGSFEQTAADGSRKARWLAKPRNFIGVPVELTRYHEPLPEPLVPYVDMRHSHEGSHSYLVHEFVDCVNKLRLPRINVWEAVRFCAPGFVAHQSALMGGRLLKVPDWGDPPESYP